MAQNWDRHVNQDAYGQQLAGGDNVEGVKYKSGRWVGHLLNSEGRKTHNLKFKFDDVEKIEGRTEFEWFLYWFDFTIMSGVLSFYFPDIITHAAPREYRIEGGYNVVGQKWKEVSLHFVEV